MDDIRWEFMTSGIVVWDSNNFWGLPLRYFMKISTLKVWFLAQTSGWFRYKPSVLHCHCIFQHNTYKCDRMKGNSVRKGSFHYNDHLGGIKVDEDSMERIYCETGRMWLHRRGSLQKVGHWHSEVTGLVVSSSFIFLNSHIPKMYC